MFSSKDRPGIAFFALFCESICGTSRSPADCADAWVGAAYGSARRDIQGLRIISGGKGLTGSLTSSAPTTWPRPSSAGTMTGCSSAARTRCFRAIDFAVVGQAPCAAL